MSTKAKHALLECVIGQTINWQTDEARVADRCILSQSPAETVIVFFLDDSKLLVAHFTNEGNFIKLLEPVARNVALPEGRYTHQGNVRYVFSSVLRYPVSDRSAFARFISFAPILGRDAYIVYFQMENGLEISGWTKYRELRLIPDCITLR